MSYEVDEKFLPSQFETQMRYKLVSCSSEYLVGYIHDISFSSFRITCLSALYII